MRITCSHPDHDTAVADVVFTAEGGVQPVVSESALFGRLPDWITLQGSFENTTLSRTADDDVWEFRYYTTDTAKQAGNWSARIEWGPVEDGVETAEGREISGVRKLCYGGGTTGSVNRVQLLLTWRNPDATSRVLCGDLQALAGSTYTFITDTGEVLAYDCDLLYTYYQAGMGAQVNCLTTTETTAQSGAAAPSLPGVPPPVPRVPIVRPAAAPEDMTVLVPGETGIFDVEIHPERVTAGQRADFMTVFDFSDESFPDNLFFEPRMRVIPVEGPDYELDPQLAGNVICRDECTMDRNLLTAEFAHTPTAITDDEAATSRENDFLLVYWDQNRDSRYQTGEPYSLVSLQIVQLIKYNYVALGDSYSSGEVGAQRSSRSSVDDFKTNNNFDERDLPGTYFGKDPYYCRRWNNAYPYRFARGRAHDVLSSEPDVKTYACTGAVTKNIYDPAGEDGDSTDRPSGRAPEKYTDRFLGLGRVAHADWEPRQSVSLDNEDNEDMVDMVTLTIGGNDEEINFGSTMTYCLFLFTCDLVGRYGGEAGFQKRLAKLKKKLVEVYTELKRVASGATVFVLGYPHLVPTVKFFNDAKNFERCLKLLRLDNAAGGWGPTLRLFGTESTGQLIDEEIGLLRRVAEDLNETIAAAAEQVGVHYVSVVDAFDGLDPCGDDPGIFGPRHAPGVEFASEGSFHPNLRGHDIYAKVLADFIEQKQVDIGLSVGELPANPAPKPPAAGGADGRQTRGVAGASGGGAAGESDSETTSSDNDQEANDGEDDGEGGGVGVGGYREVGFAGVRPKDENFSGCAAYPGMGLVVFAEGFSPGSSVKLVVEGFTSAKAALASVEVADAGTVDAQGGVEVSWSVPEMPSVDVEPGPRGYRLTLEGVAESGEPRVAVTPAKVVAYRSGAQWCAVDDTATTKIGEPVRVAVLANDVKPVGVSWDLMLLEVSSAANGSAMYGTVVVNRRDGSLVYTPDPGFVGTDIIVYTTYDKWGVGDRAQVTVTVDAGCTIVGTAGVVEINGTETDDVICVPDRWDYDSFHVIRAGGGDDIIVAGDGVEWIYGGSGSDTIYAGDGANKVDGGAGVDTIHTGVHFDTIHSDGLGDIIRDRGDPDDSAREGYELLVNPSVAVEQQAAPVVADDEVSVEPGGVVVVGVLDNDSDPDGDLDMSTLEVTQAPTLGTAEVQDSPVLGVHVVYTAGSSTGEDIFTYRVCDTHGSSSCASGEVHVTVGAAGCTITGTSGPDVLYGTSGDDVICGLGGDDVIYGLGGDDKIIGGAGDDVLYGGSPAAADSDGRNVLYGGEGSDTLYGGTDADTLWGGADADTLWGGGGDDRFYGGSGADTFDGGSGDDIVYGGLGDDSISTGSGDDIVYGGLGDDSISTGSGDDIVYGGLGDDSISTGSGDDIVYGGRGDDSIDSGDGDDVLRGHSGADRLTGGTGADILWGGTDDDILWGNTQDDILVGGPGSDTLHGGGGDDKLIGGTGDDLLYGNAGDDMLFGGVGDDALDGGDGKDYLRGSRPFDADTCANGEIIARCGM